MGSKRTYPAPTCELCGKVVHARRLCWRHYQQARRAMLRQPESAKDVSDTETDSGAPSA
jgi:hypothetical protein